MPFLTNSLRKSILNSKFSVIKHKIDNITLPERLKGTIVEKWGKYWKHLYLDYQEVVLGVLKDASDKPAKAVIVGMIGSSLYYCAKENPDEERFLQELRKHQNEVSLVEESLLNPIAKDHLVMVERVYNAGQLRRLSLGIVSFMWLDDFNKETATYRATCSYLKPEWSTFHRRIIDVGFLDQWWNFRRKMTNYDINY
ncbi:mitochondrial import inner membrane translocase subunit Tim29 [Sergentomyia squamirostris]